MSRKYRVEQYFTTGWGVVDEKAIKLTKDEARKVLENLLKGAYLISRRSSSFLPKIPLGVKIIVSIIRRPIKINLTPANC